MLPLQPFLVKLMDGVLVGCYRQVGLVDFNGRAYGVGHICPELPMRGTPNWSDLQIE
jgi:hypothetical protein